jgi:hypothetical protein
MKVINDVRFPFVMWIEKRDLKGSSGRTTSAFDWRISDKRSQNVPVYEEQGRDGACLRRSEKRVRIYERSDLKFAGDNNVPVW